MCDYLDDDGAVEYLFTATRRAAKTHACACCGRVIEPGQRYVVVSWVGEGTADSEKCCASCARVRETFGKEHSFYPHPSSVVEFLDQCVAERDDGYQRWARMLRRIRKRREEARAAS